MAKSTKHQDKVGSFENFRAPWETETGQEVDVDKGTLKRLLFNLKVGEAKALDGQEDARTEASEAARERDEAKDEAAKASPDEANRKIARLEKERDDLKAERDNLVAEKEHNALRAEVLGDLDPRYAKYVTGTTKEELEESLAAVKEDFGLTEKPGEEEVEEEDEIPARVTPKPRLRSGIDPKPNEGPDVVDFEKAADQILGRGPFG